MFLPLSMTYYGKALPFTRTVLPTQGANMSLKVGVQRTNYVFAILVHLMVLLLADAVQC
jgi:hypothetical protein